MKYTKPQDVLDAWNDHCYFTDGMKMAEFIDSLPDEFEIVQPGMRQVKWPECASKRELDLLYQTYKNPYPIKFDRPIPYDEQLATVLHALAAIAPVEKKKRKVYLWEKDYPHYTERSWTSDDISRPGEGWRKVGECEVEA